MDMTVYLTSAVEEFRAALLWHPAANCIARGVDQNFQTVQMHGLQEQDEAP